MRSHSIVAVFLLTAACAGARPAPTASKPSFVETMKREFAAISPTIASPWVKTLLSRVAELPSRAARVVWVDKAQGRAVSDSDYSKLGDKERKGLVREVEDDEVYYAKYSSPVAYSRLLDLASTAGLDGMSKKKVVDFGYGDIGQLQLFARDGAEAIGVDPSALDAALYSSPDDLGFPPGAVRLVSARWPAESIAREMVGKDIDVFLSKNTLKKGYVRPEPPAGQTVDPKKLVNLGVDPSSFLPALREATRPGALVVIYNLCPAPSKGPEYLPWADGRSPFTREEWAAAGFTLLSFDVDDTEKARELGRILQWDKTEGMDLQNDLFAWYTVARRGPDASLPNGGASR
jgi:hypothetical protein